MMLSPLLYMLSLSVCAFILDSIRRNSPGKDVAELRAMGGLPACAGVGFLFCFLFISPGSLPAHLSGAYSIYGILIPLIACSTLINGGDGRQQRILDSGMAFSLAFACVFHAASIVLLKRGAPGAPFSLEPFISVHLWDLVGIRGKTGILLLFLSLLGLLPSAGRRNQRGWGLACQLQKLCMLALMVRIFSAFSVGAIFPFGILSVFIIDFALFWIQVACTALAANLYRALPWPGLIKTKWIQAQALLLLGGILLMASELSYRF